jgi:hypothetical protein
VTWAQNEMTEFRKQNQGRHVLKYCASEPWRSLLRFIISGLRKRGSQKIPRILWHQRFVAQWVRSASTVLLLISTRTFCRESDATSCRHGQWFLNDDNTQSYSENGPQRETFHNNGEYQLECDGRDPEVFYRSTRTQILNSRWLDKCCSIFCH